MMSRFCGILILALLLGSSFVNGEEGIVPGQLILKLKPVSGAVVQSMMDSASFHDQMGVKAVTRLPESSGDGVAVQSAQGATYLVELESSSSVGEVCQHYDSQDWVEYAEPHYIVESHMTMSDPFFFRQTYLSNTDLVDLLPLEQRHEVKVAVVDTGVDMTHEDLSSQVYVNPFEVINGIDDDGNGFIDDVKGYNFYGHQYGRSNPVATDRYGHGTHIAGIIAADANNSTGIVGINDRAKIMNVRFLSQSGRGTQVDAAAAIRYAVDNGAKVINCSWGYYQFNQILKEAIQYAYDHGVVVVASVGNSSSTSRSYPSAFDSVIAVSSIGVNGQVSPFSNSGSHVDFTAYGEALYSAKPGNAYRSLSGTSQSAAVVSGIVSRVLSYYSDLTPDEVFMVLRASSRDIGAPGRDQLTGFGQISVDVLQRILTGLEATTMSVESYLEAFVASQPSVSDGSGGAVAGLQLDDVLNFPNPFSASGTTFGFTSNASGQAEVRIYNLTGREVRRLDMAFSNDYNTVFWDGKSDSGESLSNGTYLYVVELTSTTGDTTSKKGKLSILR